MVVGLLFLVLVVALVVLAVRKANARAGRTATSDVTTLRRVFQYLLLYGLLVIVAIGISGLLGRLLETDVLVTGDESALARDLTFTVVGVPLFVAVALWSRRRLAEDADEARSFGWAVYVTARVPDVPGGGDDRPRPGAQLGHRAGGVRRSRAGPAPRVGRAVGRPLVDRHAHHAARARHVCITSVVR